MSKSKIPSALLLFVVLCPGVQAQTYEVVRGEPVPLVEQISWREYRARKPWLYREYGIWADPQWLVAPPPAPLTPRVVGFGNPIVHAKEGTFTVNAVPVQGGVGVTGPSAPPAAPAADPGPQASLPLGMQNYSHLLEGQGLTTEDQARFQSLENVVNSSP